MRENSGNITQYNMATPQLVKYFGRLLRLRNVDAVKFVLLRMAVP